MIRVPRERLAVSIKLYCYSCFPSRLCPPPLFTIVDIYFNHTLRLCLTFTIACISLRTRVRETSSWKLRAYANESNGTERQWGRRKLEELENFPLSEPLRSPLFLLFVFFFFFFFRRNFRASSNVTRDEGQMFPTRLAVAVDNETTLAQMGKKLWTARNQSPRSSLSTRVFRTYWATKYSGGNEEKKKRKEKRNRLDLRVNELGRMKVNSSYSETFTACVSEIRVAFSRERGLARGSLKRRRSEDSFRDRTTGD